MPRVSRLRLWATFENQTGLTVGLTSLLAMQFIYTPDESFAGNFPKKDQLFHLSLEPIEDTLFKPRVPSNFLTKNGFEDSVTKRISFSTSIDDALKGMSSNLRGKKLYVYTAPHDTKFVSPSILQVPDSKITAEKWVLKETNVNFVGEIQITNAVEEPFAYTYGDNLKADLYGWNWKPLIRAESGNMGSNPKTKPLAGQADSVVVTQTQSA